jgi:hypothetical protein
MRLASWPLAACALLLALACAGCVAHQPTSGSLPPAVPAPTKIVSVAAKTLLSTPMQRASEFWVDRDPRDPLRLAMGRMEFTTADNFCLFALTTDGGLTWHDTPRPFPGTASDPWVAWAPDGTLHAVCNTSNYAQSHDEGATWERKTKPDSPGNDRPSLLVDHRGRLLDCSSMPGSNQGPVLVYSDDQGATWTRSSFTFITPDWQQTICNRLDEAPDGTLYVTLGLSQFHIAVSTDRGATWTLRAGIAMDDPRRANEGTLLPTHKEGNMYPAFAVSPLTGHLLAAVLRFHPADDAGLGSYGIELYRSTDQGATLEPLAWPVAPASCQPCDVTRPVLHVDGQGRVGALWRTATLSLPVQTWFSASLDEGATWLPPVLLSTEAPDQNGFTPRSIDGADHYWAMADSPHGFLAFWLDRTADGWSGLWTQALRLE